MAHFWETLTLETAPEKQREEFIKKYRGSWVWIDLPNFPPRLCRFEAYNVDTKSYAFSYKTLPIVLKHDTDAVIRFLNFQIIRRTDHPDLVHEFQLVEQE